jgi:hypothetical protein
MEQTMNDCNCEGAIGGKLAAVDPSPPKALNVSGLFLNTHPDSRAPCDGRVVGWGLCYYIDDTQQQDNDLTIIKAGVWRQQNSSEYQLLNNSLVELQIPEPASGVQFVCQHWRLINNTAFGIKKGDIVGVYVDGKGVVHVLGNSTNDAQDNEIMSAVDITGNETSVSELNSTSYSLYLKAMLGMQFDSYVLTILIIRLFLSPSQKIVHAHALINPLLSPLLPLLVLLLLVLLLVCKLLVYSSRICLIYP